MRNTKPLIIEQGDPYEPQTKALLEASHKLMLELFNVDECHFLSLDSLKSPEIYLYSARKGDKVLGTGALADRQEYGEVKSMFVTPNARGHGVAKALLRQIEDQARFLCLPALKLETGDKLIDAIHLYENAGFKRCEPFGDYVQAPHSVFMEKPLIYTHN